MPDENENNIAISELDEALDLTDSAQFPYTQNNGGTLTTFKARLTQIAAKIIEGLSFAGINLPTSAGDKTVENSINFLLDSVGGDPNGNISDSYDPTATYNTGDVCIYNNVLYICTDDNITGTFDPSKWTATTIDNLIGSLSTLTTTDKSSLVGAVNEVNGGKADKTSFAKKTYTTTNAINIGANTIDTQTIAINDANFGIVVGFAITNNTDVVIMQCYFNSTTELVVRVRNVSANAGTYKFSIIYI